MFCGVEKVSRRVISDGSGFWCCWMLDRFSPRPIDGQNGGTLYSFS